MSGSYLGTAHVLDGEHELEILHHVAVNERLLRVAACRQRSDGHFDAACAQTFEKVDHTVLRLGDALVPRGDELVHAIEHLLLGQRQVWIAFQKILRDLRLGKALAYRVVRVCDVNVELRKVALCQSFPDRHGVQKRAVHVENCTFEILHWFCSFRERIS